MLGDRAYNFSGVSQQKSPKIPILVSTARVLKQWRGFLHVLFERPWIEDRCQLVVRGQGSLRWASGDNITSVLSRSALLLRFLEMLRIQCLSWVALVHVWPAGHLPCAPYNSMYPESRYQKKSESPGSVCNWLLFVQ